MSDRIYERPVELLQTLLCFDTTNPPGNEAACVSYLDGLLRAAGIETQVVGRNAERTNLIARLPGRGDAPPLMLEGHVDVVSTADQGWEHPPFDAEIVDGMLWGRGALDDKGSVAIMTAALLKMKAEIDAGGSPLPGDVLLVVVCDEEVGAEFGAKFLVEQHPTLFDGIVDAIGEGGGVSVRMAGHKFYPIMVAEKQICSMKVTVRGAAGHGSTPLRGEAMAKLGAVLRTLDRQRLPVHITPTARGMLKAMGAVLPFPVGTVLRQLSNPLLTDVILDALGTQATLLNPLLHNTVSPTMVHGGTQINVIPGAIELFLDGRLLPGFGPEDMRRELSALLGDDVTLEVLKYEPGPTEQNTALYATLADLMREADPEGTPVPFLLSGVTDARHFAKLGIRMVGFTPFDLPDGLIQTIHSANECIPVDTVEWGTNVMLDVLRRYRG